MWYHRIVTEKSEAHIAVEADSFEEAEERYQEWLHSEEKDNVAYLRKELTEHYEYNDSWDTGSYLDPFHITVENYNDMKIPKNNVKPVKAHKLMGSVDIFTFKTRDAAEKVLNYLLAKIAIHGYASVADYYENIGASFEYMMTYYGWTYLGAARVKETADGFIINLPRPISLIDVRKDKKTEDKPIEPANSHFDESTTDRHCYNPVIDLTHAKVLPEIFKDVDMIHHSLHCYNLVIDLTHVKIVPEILKDVGMRYYSIHNITFEEFNAEIQRWTKEFKLVLKHSKKDSGRVYYEFEAYEKDAKQH